MSGEFRYLPQKTLDDITVAVNPLLDVLLVITPHLTVLLILAGIGRACVQWRLSFNKALPRPDGPWLLHFILNQLKPPVLTLQQERDLRAVPLSVGLIGLTLLHLALVLFPNLVGWWNSEAGQRGLLETVGMALAFFTMLAIFNLQLRHLLDPALRKQFALADIGVIGHVLGALGAGIYAWATVRWASQWTGTVAWQHFLDCWMFRFSDRSAVYSLPTMAKLHIILGATAFGVLLHSRMVTHLLIPNIRVWGFKSLERGISLGEAGRVAARMSGVSAEKEKGGHH
ncbi:MAG: respiratory nitrate reductase subunit gamma [Planctomycetes bacterium]|jgi:nitrate reductase gamma subunit|nr:respiratory nitrate reductase subunit gamma [Planctomycetota bacterium]MCL4731849.1 respiratory nitrate reductase subunit gamma [Planctomycetota bacterium]